MATEKQKYDMKQIKLYLAKKGVPPAMLDSIRMALIDDSIRNSEALRTDRIYCLLALAINQAYGYGAKRIMRCLQAFDELNGQFVDPDADVSWHALMKELRDKTGLVISQNTEDRIAFEYRGDKDED